MSKQCEVRDGTVIPCTTQDKAVDDLYTRTKKGLFDLTVSVLSTNTWKTKGYGIKSGEYKKSGMMFNYCPFCGTDIGSHLKTKEVLGDE